MPAPSPANDNGLKLSDATIVDLIIALGTRVVALPAHMRGHAAGMVRYAVDRMMRNASEG